MGTDPTIRLWRENANSLPQTLVGLRRVCHARLASSGPCQYGIGLSSSPLCFLLLLLAWLGLGPIVIIWFRPRGLTQVSVSFRAFLLLLRLLIFLRCFFLLVEMDLLSFIRNADPTKVRVGERQRAEGEPKLFDTTVGGIVSLLLVSPARASSELEACVEKLFYEGGSGSHTERGDSVSGGHGVDIPQVNRARVIMSSASSVVTYTSVYTDFEPGRVFCGADEEISDGGPPRVIVLGYDGLPMIASMQALIDAVTAALPSPPLPPLPPSLYIPPPVDHRDDVPESELPPRKRLCLSTLGPSYEIGESSTARPIRDRGIDYGFVSTVDAEARR
ncbi:hypothetical protein Tco_1049348 [Tanacetum coccineum]